MIIEFEGKLVYSDYAEYVLEKEDGEMFDLSSLLSDIYLSPVNNWMSIRIERGVRLIFIEEDILYQSKNAIGIYSYHIAMEDLEKVLFYNTDKYLNIMIDSPVIKNAEKYIQ